MKAKRSQNIHNFLFIQIFANQFTSDHPITTLKIINKMMYPLISYFSKANIYYTFSTSENWYFFTIETLFARNLNFLLKSKHKSQMNLYIVRSTLYKIKYYSIHIY